MTAALAAATGAKARSVMVVSARLKPCPSTAQIFKLTTTDSEVGLTSRGFSTLGRAFLRVAGSRTGENRWVRALYKGASVTLQSTTRVLHVLWLEVTGLFFMVLAIVGAAAAVREHHRQLAGAGSTSKVVLAAGFAVLFGYFGVSSFWRSRKR